MENEQTIILRLISIFLLFVSASIQALYILPKAYKESLVGDDIKKIRRWLYTALQASFISIVASIPIIGVKVLFNDMIESTYGILSLLQSVFVLLNVILFQRIYSFGRSKKKE